MTAWPELSQGASNYRGTGALAGRLYSAWLKAHISVETMYPE